jgi:UDP-3-O-[3-hydroxymyristoyl] glucosamine N-acyltransferase
MKFNSKVFLKLYGHQIDFSVSGVSQSSNLKSNTICFCLNIEQMVIETLASCESVIIFIPKASVLPDDCYKGNVLIECENPRFEYIKTTRYAFSSEAQTFSRELSFIDPSATVAPTAIVSPFCFVGPNCVIGADCFLAPGVRLIDSVHVGRETRIGSNTVIGGWGFGIERNNGKEREVIPFGGEPLKMPHFGGVIIGKNCDIGALTTICAGAIEPTLLEDYVMVDDHVHISHNCKLREGSAIVACAEISGSVEIGEETWVGPNSSVMQKISIGSACIIGIGSVVLKSVPCETVIVGNPGRALNK